MKKTQKIVSKTNMNIVMWQVYLLETDDIYSEKLKTRFNSKKYQVAHKY